MRIFTTVTTLAFCMHAVLCQMPGGLSSGVGGMGIMGAGMGMMGDMGPTDYMILDSAVKQIVGPNATPTAAMIMLGNQQGGPPRTLAQVTPYITLMQDLAVSSNVNVPGVKGKATPQQIRNHVHKNAMNWFRQRTALGTMSENPLVASSMLGGGLMGTGNTAGGQQGGMFNMMAMAEAMGMDGLAF